MRACLGSVQTPGTESGKVSNGCSALLSMHLFVMGQQKMNATYGFLGNSWRPGSIHRVLKNAVDSAKILQACALLNL